MPGARGGTVWSPYELNNPNSFPPWQGMMGAVAAPNGRGLVAAQTDESVTNQVTYPGPPSGFSAISDYAFPEYFTWDPNAQVQTWDFTIYVPAQISADDWTGFMQTVHDDMLSVGDDILAYEIDEQPLVDFSVPDQFCIPDPLGGSPICVTPPGGGTTIQVGFAYRIWAVIGSGYGPPSGYRAAVRGQILAAISILIGVLSVVGGILLIKDIFNGTLTLQSLQSFAQGIFTIPGQNIQQAEQPLTSTILILGGLSTALGIFAIIHGMQPPSSAPVSVGGTLNGPGGIGIGGNVSTGGTTFAPQQSRSRR